MSKHYRDELMEESKALRARLRELQQQAQALQQAAKDAQVATDELSARCANAKSSGVESLPVRQLLIKLRQN